MIDNFVIADSMIWVFYSPAVQLLESWILQKCDKVKHFIKQRHWKCLFFGKILIWQLLLLFEFELSWPEQTVSFWYQTVPSWSFTAQIRLNIRCFTTHNWWLAMLLLAVVRWTFQALLTSFPEWVTRGDPIMIMSHRKTSYLRYRLHNACVNKLKIILEMEQ